MLQPLTIVGSRKWGARDQQDTPSSSQTHSSPNSTSLVASTSSSPLAWLKALRKDFQIIFERDPAARNWLEVMFCYPGLHALALHRVAHYLHSHCIVFLPRFLSHLGRFLTGIEIHPGATIGQGHIHDLGERLNGLGGTPAASFTKLADLCCFTPEEDGVFPTRQMLEHDLAAEQAIISLIRRQASQAESIGDRATRYLYEQILLATEERAFHVEHFLAQDTLVQFNN